MALIEWRDEFRIGIDAVDHEHRELIALINRAHDSISADASREVVERFLGEIFAKIAAHFALEESVMRRCRYDRYLEHKQDHEALLDDILEIITEFDAGGYDRMSEELSHRLRDWFVAHFKSKDARLHELLGVF
ncbi:MAG: hemerythrin family protein [Rhodospirillales bacterium]|nr:hemerythrin family protein [Rhodospirillales bacterium]MBO6785549.1 hemerythrin family protein [Rhodospirillales bacterium]